MSKKRLAAFTDAVLAITMTMLIIQLTKPAEPTLEALWDLREEFFAYALSFFWLGSMWVSLHNVWNDAEVINKSVIWCNIILLFFASLMPYATSLVSTYYDSAVIQGLYGVIVILVTIAKIILNKLLANANKDNYKVQKITKSYINYLIIAVFLKLFGLVIAITIYPPAMMIVVLITAICMIIFKNKVE